MDPVRIAVYADLYCPYAYITMYRLRQLREDYRGRVSIAHKSLALEYVNREPTPKAVLDAELPILMLEEPDIPYEPWHTELSAWPVTMWPAFEAVACAERQGLDLADDLDWAIRVAFFAESQCVSMRHVLLDLAERVGLNMQRFTADLDSGAAKQQVIDDAREGWERLKVPGSPTLVLPSGRQISDLGLPEVLVDTQRHARVTGLRPATCSGSACLALLRQLLDEAVGRRV